MHLNKILNIRIVFYFICLVCTSGCSFTKKYLESEIDESPSQSSNDIQIKNLVYNPAKKNTVIIKNINSESNSNIVEIDINQLNIIGKPLWHTKCFNYN